MKIMFLGKEYSVESFEYEVDIFSLSNSELDQYFDLLPKIKYKKTGNYTWNGDDQYYESIESYICDDRYNEVGK